MLPGRCACPEGGMNIMTRMPVVDMAATGANILQLRIANDMTVKDLQGVFGFATPQAIYKWQQGRDLPTVDNLVILAAVFRVTVDDILVISY